MANSEKVKSPLPASAFHVLGLEDADDLVLRSELIRKVAGVIREKKLSQTAVGELIGMDQPRVSALLNEKISKFSTERLLKALNDLGQDVELTIKPSLKPRGSIQVLDRNSGKAA